MMKPQLFARGIVAGLAATAILSAMMLMKQSTGLMPELDPMRMIAVMVGVNSPIAGRIGHFSLPLVKLPDALKDEPEVACLQRAACQTSMDIVELIYRPEAPLGPPKDYQFLGGTMERRWERGLNGARAALASAPWLEPAPTDIAVRTFDIGA